MSPRGADRPARASAGAVGERASEPAGRRGPAPGAPGSAE